MKSSNDKKPMTRRDWMRLAGRGGIAAGLGALGTYLLSRSENVSAKSACGRKISCRKCRDESTCYLPRAIAARRRKDLS
jgi:hypothetical protein